MAERYSLPSVGTDNPYPENTARHAAFEAGRASLAANAGSEPVAWVDERALSWLANSRSLSATITTKLERGKSFERPMPLYTHPSPPEGMVGGWRPIETAPKDGTEILLYAQACEYEGATVKPRTTYGHWRAPSETPSIKYQDGFAPEPEWEDFEPFWASWDGGFTEEHPPTHWMPLPPPPTSSADSSKEQP